MKDNYLTKDLIEVRNVPGKGRGVFAMRNFKKGDIIEIAPILMVPLNDDAYVGCTFLQHYLFNVVIGKEEFSAIGLGFSSLYNHSNKYNADYLTSNKVIIIEATKPIKKGSEITIHYGWSKGHCKEVGIK